ncbi:Udp-n-acetylmuramoyl-tripeptide--d-alanyl-d-alanine ligase [Thalictrum thalictroides]|uniref:Udp-n-acetylmuramoyl-tripeptide--d-alanyl-d-alanine ligase n=1 Tax=Thalictrum thalictroides TaxID=46969 RepID=A0A7J6WG17_THATH|nr:Udp-n-acetylmuramoyl-tripeptide--d-alanyl-d-alanine ligase [Thalictrum thalictroides]
MNKIVKIPCSQDGYLCRNRFKGHVVGVTGSVGKTTTRTMIALALQNLGLVHQTNGNQNNHIGVAFTLIGIPGNAQVAVVEMGMRRKGEILKLAKEIASAKGEILREMKPGDVCVMNADDPLVMSLPVPLGVKKVLFGRRMECDVRLVVAESTNGGYGVGVVLEWNTEMVEFVIQSPGLHLTLNACATAAVSAVLGVSRQFAKSLARFTPVSMRSELDIAENGVRIINDVYNANPTSTKAAISLLESIECRGKRVAILGDMLELGTTEVEAHETVLSLCCVASIGLVALVGKKFISAAEKLKLSGTKKVICSLESEALALQITESINKNDVVLVKGSRNMKMEKVVDAIKAIH